MIHRRRSPRRQFAQQRIGSEQCRLHVEVDERSAGHGREGARGDQQAAEPEEHDGHADLRYEQPRRQAAKRHDAQANEVEDGQDPTAHPGRRRTWSTVIEVTW